MIRFNLATLTLSGSFRKNTLVGTRIDMNHLARRKHSGIDVVIRVKLPVSRSENSRSHFNTVVRLRRVD